MTYTQAKLAAIDETITDWRRLREASALLLSRLNASTEDIYDAEDLARRAVTLQCKLMVN